MPDDPAPQDSVPSLKLNLDALLDELRQRSDVLARMQEQIDGLAGRDSIGISDMFELQMQMNKLSQLSELSTGIVSATNSTISSMARNVKA